MTINLLRISLFNFSLLIYPRHAYFSYSIQLVLCMQNSRALRWFQWYRQRRGANFISSKEGITFFEGDDAADHRVYTYARSHAKCSSRRVDHRNWSAARCRHKRWCTGAWLEVEASSTRASLRASRLTSSWIALSMLLGFKPCEQAPCASISKHRKSSPNSLANVSDSLLPQRPLISSSALSSNPTRLKSRTRSHPFTFVLRLLMTVDLTPRLISRVRSLAATATAFLKLVLLSNMYKPLLTDIAGSVSSSQRVALGRTSELRAHLHDFSSDDMQLFEVMKTDWFRYLFKVSWVCRLFNAILLCYFFHLLIFG